MPALPVPATRLAHVIALATSFWHYHSMFRRQYDLARFPLILVSGRYLWVPPPSPRKSPPPTPHQPQYRELSLPISSKSRVSAPPLPKKILDTRKSYGAFKSVDDLLAIKGIGPKKLEKMRKYLTVAKPPARKQSNSPAKPPLPPPNPRPQNPLPNNRTHPHPPQAKTKSHSCNL